MAMAEDHDHRLLLLHPHDNVLVAREAIAAGCQLCIGGQIILVAQDIARAHKIARTAIATGEAVLKYAAPIGKATQPIAAGEHVHIHNLVSNYTPTHVIPSGEELGI